MESDDCRLARLAAAAVLARLMRRKGFNSWWSGISPNGQEDIEHTLYIAILDVARPIMATELPGGDT